MRKPDLHNDSIKSLFYFYLSSSIIGMVIRSIHSFLDGIFVGNGVSEEALAAVNMSLPVITAFTSIALLFAAGGATNASIELGKGDEKKAQNFFMSSMITMVGSVVIIQLMYFLFRDSVISLLGANEVLYPLVKSYGSTMMAFAPIMAISIGLTVFVRNDGNPQLVMKSNVVGAITNAALNALFIFVFKMGLFGAALGTGLAQFMSSGILLTHFKGENSKLKLSFKEFGYSIRNMSRVVKVGFPNWIGEVAFGVVWIVLVRAIMAAKGELGVSAFSITFYVCNIGYSVMYGVSHAVQPIISFNFGAKSLDRVKQAYRLGLGDALKIGALFLAITVVFAQPIVRLFGADSQELINLAVQTNRYIALTYLFVAYNMSGSTLFQSMGDGTTSLIIQLLRGFILPIILITVLPNYLGFLGIMLVFPLTEVTASIFTAIFMKKRQKVIKGIF